PRRSKSNHWPIRTAIEEQPFVSLQNASTISLVENPASVNAVLVAEAQLKRPLLEENEGHNKRPRLEETIGVTSLPILSLIKLNGTEVSSFLKDVLPSQDLRDDDITLHDRGDRIAKWLAQQRPEPTLEQTSPNPNANAEQTSLNPEAPIGIVGPGQLGSSTGPRALGVRCTRAGVLCPRGLGARVAMHSTFPRQTGTRHAQACAENSGHSAAVRDERGTRRRRSSAVRCRTTGLLPLLGKKANEVPLLCSKVVRTGIPADHARLQSKGKIEQGLFLTRVSMVLPAVADGGAGHGKEPARGGQRLAGSSRWRNSRRRARHGGRRKGSNAVGCRAMGCGGSRRAEERRRTGSVAVAVRDGESSTLLHVEVCRATVDEQWVVTCYQRDEDATRSATTGGCRRRADDSSKLRRAGFCSWWRRRAAGELRVMPAGRGSRGSAACDKPSGGR
ncbi:cadherin EGF LAG seven-pass G-type receptor 3, partial [Striga asiatica]